MRVAAFAMLVAGVFGACGPSRPIDWSSGRIPRDSSFAVLALDKSGKPWVEVAGLYEGELLRLGFRVVDRARLETLVEEQKLGLTGLLAANEAARIGQMAGASHVLTCTPSGFNQCALRIVSISRGEVIASTSYVGINAGSARQALRSAIEGPRN